MDILPFTPSDYFYTPRAIRRSKYHLDARVYSEIVMLAIEAGEETFTLPARHEMANRCGCGKDQYSASLKRLEPYVIIMQPAKISMKVRTQVRVKTYTTGIVETGFQGQLAYEGKQHSTGLHKVYSEPFDKNLQFPPELTALKNSIKSIASLPDGLLFALSYHSDLSQIGIALHEIQSYNKSIGNIEGFFRALFIKDEKGSGRLNPNRKSLKSATRLTQSDVVLKKDHYPSVSSLPLKQHAAELQASIYPDSIHSSKDVDKICRELNDRGSVDEGNLPQSLRQLSVKVPILVRHEVENFRVKLADNCILEQKEKGYWVYHWEKPVYSYLNEKNERNNVRDDARPMSEALQPVESTN